VAKRLAICAKRLAIVGAWHKHRYNAILCACLTGHRDYIAYFNDTIRPYTL
jgi:hypothetical protein